MCGQPFPVLVVISKSKFNCPRQRSRRETPFSVSSSTTWHPWTTCECGLPVPGFICLMIPSINLAHIQCVANPFLSSLSSVNANLIVHARRETPFSPQSSDEVRRFAERAQHMCHRSVCRGISHQNSYVERSCTKSLKANTGEAFPRIMLFQDCLYITVFSYVSRRRLGEPWNVAVPWPRCIHTIRATSHTLSRTVYLCKGC